MHGGRGAREATRRTSLNGMTTPENRSGNAAILWIDLRCLPDDGSLKASIFGGDDGSGRGGLLSPMTEPFAQ